LQRTGVLGDVQAAPASPVLARFAREQPGHRLRAPVPGSALAAGAEEKNMALIVATRSFEMVEALRPLVARIRRHDRSLADQLVRAASSVALNVAEANYSDPGNRKARLFTAAGSANETRTALRLAVAWGYVPAEAALASEALLEQVLAMLWKLART
jgi:four helix bundle protein